MHFTVIQKWKTLQVISSSLIQMENPNSSSISTLQLTPWDLQFLQFDPIQKGILFNNPDEKDFIDRLKSSLSRALDYFPPLAGRLATVTHSDGNLSFFVDCNNAGVEFTHAIAGTVTVTDIAEPRYVPEVVNSFFPLDGVINCDAVSKPLFGVQVTELADGFFLGFSANHVVIDGVSFWHFINSWSEICRGSETISRLPVFKRWLPDNCLKLADGGHIPIPPISEEKLIRNAALPPLLQRVFHFGKETIAKLKIRANSEAGMDNISSLQAVLAHLWRGVVRWRNNLKSEKPAAEEEVGFTLVVGLRGRLTEIHNDYFGNALTVGKMSCREGDILEKGLGYAGKKINELVGQQSGEAAVEYVVDWVKNPAVSGRITGGAAGFAVASTPRHNVYGNDFRWGKPIAVRSGKSQKFDGKMSVFPTAESGGIDVEACLAPATLRAMENDVEFMEAFVN